MRTPDDARMNPVAGDVLRKRLGPDSITKRVAALHPKTGLDVDLSDDGSRVEVHTIDAHGAVIGRVWFSFPAWRKWAASADVVRVAQPEGER